MKPHTHPHRELALPNRDGEWVGLEMCNIQTGCGTLACFVLYLIDLNFVCGIPKLCLNPDIVSTTVVEVCAQTITDLPSNPSASSV